MIIDSGNIYRHSAGVIYVNEKFIAWNRKLTYDNYICVF
jgi:hypothetical protein